MSFQAYLDNVQAKTGKSAHDFVRLARNRGLVEFNDIIAWLKKDFGLGLGHARAIAHVIRHGDVSKGRSAADKKKKAKTKTDR
jgi:hypothetical protein